MIQHENIYCILTMTTEA